MMRSLFAGVSGLRNHQVRMDVIGNNIANVNTVGFKASRVTFEEAFAQLVQGASRPAGASLAAGGTNPIQVGLGMNIGSIDMLFTQGNLENTGVTTDLAIQGDSFFVVSDGVTRYFTRSGNFQFDADGRLVAPTNGFVVQGRMAVDGVLGDRIEDIRVPFGMVSPARATSQARVIGNLDAEAADGTVHETTITVYDSLGTRHDLTVVFTRSGGSWGYEIYADDDRTTALATGTLAFGPDGRLQSPEEQQVTFDPGTGADPLDITVRFGTAGALDGLTQFGGATTALFREQDGYTKGELQRISIDKDGTIVGAFTNGVILTLGQIALADFNNPEGLLRVGDNMYSVSPNSGEPVVGFSGEGSSSIIISGALEMSNVDLAQEFTAMITAQRGFQANARVITTSDEMLQELSNLKR